MRQADVATERVTVLMTAAEKAALEGKAKEIGVSVGEFVRRSVDSFDPAQGADLGQLAALASELVQSNAEAAAALDKALETIAATRAQLDGRAAA